MGEERIASMLPPGLKVTVSKQKDSKAETEDERRPIEVTLDSSDEEDEKANSGVTVRRMVSSPRVKERVKSGSLVKERVGSGSKVKERVKSGSLEKERVVSGSRVRERVESGSRVKEVLEERVRERVVSGSRVKECSVRLVPVSAGAVGVCGECGQGAGRAALAPAPGALPEGRAVREEAISVISWEDSREHRWPLTFKGVDVAVHDRFGHLVAHDSGLMEAGVSLYLSCTIRSILDDGEGVPVGRAGPLKSWRNFQKKVILGTEVEGVEVEYHIDTRDFSEQYQAALQQLDISQFTSSIQEVLVDLASSDEDSSPPSPPPPSRKRPPWPPPGPRRRRQGGWPPPPPSPPARPPGGRRGS